MGKKLQALLAAFCLALPALYLTILTASGMYILEGDGENSEDIFEMAGFVAGINGSLLHIVGEPFAHAGHWDIVVDGADGQVYDLLTGFPTSIDNIKEGQNVRVAYDRSQRALAVWLNYGHAHGAVFSATVSENIWYGTDYCVFLCTDSKYRITLTAETVIIDPYHGKILSQDVLPGQSFFIWVDTITASSPSLVYPEKVVLFDD